MAKKELENKLIAAIRVRGRVNVRESIRNTLERLNLKRVNNLALIKGTSSTIGMLHKCNDYITYGEVSKDTLAKLFAKKGIALDDKSISDLINGLKSPKELGIKIPIRPPPFRIFLELDGSKSLEELMEEVLEKKKYIDVAVIGFPNGHFDVDEVRKKVSKLRDILPVGIDSASTEELIEGVKAGASFVFNLNEENLEKLESIRNLSAFVIAPLSVENKADLTLKIYERAKKIGFEKLILDPILSPPLLGVVDSIIDYKKVRESVSEPMLMGILNVTELIDADSVGINALLTSIAGELGIGNLLTMENGKTVGSVFEVKKATQMVSISLTQKKLPKNIGVDLLILKDKKRYQENPIDIINPEVVKGHEEPKMMDNGFVKIIKDDKWIYLTWYGKERFTIIGDDGLTIGRKLVQRTNINPEHAIYIGYELAKAEIALKLNKNYVQDKPLFKYDKGDDSINNNEGDD